MKQSHYNEESSCCWELQFEPSATSCMDKMQWMRAGSVIRGLPASIQYLILSHITHHPSSTAIGSPPEASTPSALWDIHRCIHPWISLFLLLCLSGYLFILHLKLHHCSLLHVITAHEQHPSISSCIPPSCPVFIHLKVTPHKVISFCFSLILYCHHSVSITVSWSV